jgi:hypothetical protein
MDPKNWMGVDPTIVEISPVKPFFFFCKLYFFRFLSIIIIVAAMAAMTVAAME